MIAENDGLSNSEVTRIEKAIDEAYRGWSDAQRRSIWYETESGMTDDDSLCDTSFNGIGYALQVENPTARMLVAAIKKQVQGNVVPNTRGPMDVLDSEWQRKGATLSDKTARQEFGLTQEEIVRAIRAGKLHYRVNSIFGNPFLRLLRREVEAQVKKKHGADYLKARQAKTEVARIDRELRRLRTQIAALEEQKSRLTDDFARSDSRA